MSAPLPHSVDLDEGYDAALLALEGVVAGARRRGYMSILGVDANAVIGAGVDGDDDRVIGRHGHGGATNEGMYLPPGCTGSA